MVSKLISFGKDRFEAIKNLNDALKKFVLFGVESNLSYLNFILNHEKFLNGKFTTSFIDNHLSNFKDDSNPILTLPKIFQILNSNYITDSIHDAILKEKKFHLKINETNLKNEIKLAHKNLIYKIKFDFIKENKIHLEIDSENEKNLTETFLLDSFEFKNRTLKFSDKEFFFQNGTKIYYFDNSINYKFDLLLDENETANDQSKNYKSPMPGKITKLFIKENQDVLKNEILVVIEAMKMENLVKAKKDSKIDKIYFKEGDLVSSDETLFTIL